MKDTGDTRERSAVVDVCTGLLNNKWWLKHLTNSHCSFLLVKA